MRNFLWNNSCYRVARPEVSACLECLVADVKKDIIIVGDFNFPEIDWDLHYSTNKSFGSTVF